MAKGMKSFSGFGNVAFIVLALVAGVGGFAMASQVRAQVDACSLPGFGPCPSGDSGDYGGTVNSTESCGPAMNQKYVQKPPESALCKPDSTLEEFKRVDMEIYQGAVQGSKNRWNWYCRKPGLVSVCWATAGSFAESAGPTNWCGSANGKSISGPPSREQLCASGASATGNPTQKVATKEDSCGGFVWVCMGSDGFVNRCESIDPIWQNVLRYSACIPKALGSSTSETGGGKSDTGLVYSPPKIKIDGFCGNAARNYGEGETAFSGSLCYTGLPDPINPTFPSMNGSSSWSCTGLTGGNVSSLCTATRGTQAPGAGVPSTCSVYTSASSSIPEGYGSPFNQLSSAKESLLSVNCSSSGAIATAGSQNTYVYKTGFVSRNGQWEKIDFSGNPDLNNEGWFAGSSLANLPASNGNQNFVIAFVCQYSNGSWKCGCRDGACTQNYWTLQAYKK